MNTSVAEFAAKQLELLEIERKAEADVTKELLTSHFPAFLAKNGFAAINLQIASSRTGPGGKTIIDLEPDGVTSQELGAHDLRVGDIVRVAEMPSGSAKKREKQEAESGGVDCVICRISESKISAVVDIEDAELPTAKRIWVVKLANDITYKRMSQSMTKLEKATSSSMTPLASVLLGQSSPHDISTADLSKIASAIEWDKYALNDSQQSAVTFALAAHDIALIHGPPGTGKTHTLIAIILLLLKEKKRVLVCGPSNASVDNICDRLSHHGVPMLRLGHPARLLPSVLQHSLDVLTHTSDAGQIVKDIRQEMDLLQASLRKKMSRVERRTVYAELKALRKDFREREKKCITDLVQGAQVVLATLHGSGGWQLNNTQFDVVIVDEASQALEAQTWIPILWTAPTKLILAGDHLQLPPTIKSLNDKSGKAKSAKDNKSFTLEKTLFDRLLDLHGSKLKRMLTTQYRMHQKIMTFPSTELYDSKLEAHDSVKNHLLSDLPYKVESTADTIEPLVFYDTQGGDFPENLDEEEGAKGSLQLGESKSNTGEALLAKRHVEALVEAGIRPSDIAVITPYNSQLALLSRLMKEEYPAVELGSVDGFQGREKEVVVVSLVRSGGEVGFLAEKRRLNVSMTRPRRHLCVIGDSATLSKGGRFLKNWMTFLEDNADLRYPDLQDLNVPVR